MAIWYGDNKEHRNRIPNKKEKGWHRPVKDENYWFKYDGIDPQIVEDHIKIWKNFTDKPVFDRVSATPEFENFLFSNAEDKSEIILSTAYSSVNPKQDTDDALFRSPEFIRITKNSMGIEDFE